MFAESRSSCAACWRRFSCASRAFAASVSAILLPLLLLLEEEEEEDDDDDDEEDEEDDDEEDDEEEEEEAAAFIDAGWALAAAAGALSALAAFGLSLARPYSLAFCLILSC